MASGYSMEALISQISAATAVWNGVQTSSLHVNFGGYSKLTGAKPAANLVGLVRFSSEVPPGVAATGGYASGSFTDASAFIPIAMSYLNLPTDMRQTDLELFAQILVHEMGHSLGLSHSVVNSVMVQTSLAGRINPLTRDDEAAISTLYPTQAFLSTTGSVSGKVSDARGPAALVAVTAYSDTAVVGANSNPDGSFAIHGLPPGTYRLMAQPLMLGAGPDLSADNPGDPDDLIACKYMNDKSVTINVSVAAAFLGAGGAAVKDAAQAATFTVTAGQTTSAPALTLAARSTSLDTRLEVDITMSAPAATIRSVGQLWLPRGGQAVAYTFGRGLNAPGLNVSFTSAGLGISGPITVTAYTTVVFNTVISYTATASSSATLGFSSIIVNNGSEIYFSPGQVRVVAGGAPTISALSPSSGPAGTQVTITGTNFNSQPVVFFDGMPASVVSASSTSLVVTAPQGVGGHTASVVVGNPDGQNSDFLAAPLKFTYDAVAPASIALSPASGSAGQTVTVTVTGSGTHFAQGVTSLGFGSGDVVVDSITVNSATSLTATVTVLRNPESTSYPVTTVTGQEVAYLPSGFSIAAASRSLVQQSGNLQFGTPGSTLANPLVVRAQSEAELPISGVTVTFTVTFGGGSVSPASVATNSSGLASTQLKLGPNAGPNVVTASASGYSSVSFLAGGGSSNNSALPLMLPNEGDNQTGATGSVLPNPLTLTFVDQNRQPIPGVQIKWAVTVGGGSITATSPVSDSSGKVSATWTLGPTVGTQNAVACLAGDYDSGRGKCIVVVSATSGLLLDPFTFTATAVGGPTPVVPANGAVNGASFNSGVAALAPGAIASIFGTNLSAAPVTGAQPGFVSGTDVLQTTANGTRVTFDGVAAPLFFLKHDAASYDQLNVQVPFELAGKTSAQLVVYLNGKPSAAVTVAIQPVSPALFTVCACGTGAAVIQNQDYTINTQSNPAARGDVILLYATGLGPTSPVGITGKAAPHAEPLAITVSQYSPTITIGGVSASVEFSGLAPWFVGLWQVNVRVPASAPTGEQPLVLTTGGSRANPVTVFIK